MHYVVYVYDSVLFPTKPWISTESHSYELLTLFLGFSAFFLVKKEILEQLQDVH